MQSDLDLLHITSDPASDEADKGSDGTWCFTVDGHLARIDGKLYGGSAIAASIAVVEARTSRPVVWMTTQFVATADRGEVVTVGVEELAAGRSATQVRVTGSDSSGRVLFASLGAAGDPVDGRPRGVFLEPPRVASFEDSEPWGGPIATMVRLHSPDITPPTVPGVGFMSLVEFTEPEVLHHPDDGPGRMVLWARRRDGGPMTAAVVAYIADVVPLSVAVGLDIVSVGTSLDNTIRVDPAVRCDQVLLDLRPQAATGGCCYGEVHAWTPDGDLLGTASQTAILRPLDPAVFGAGGRG